ncbi:hypothetical protein SAMN05428945_4289 [Streptomyces sp. 2224.1]|nr:hypothetical protein BX261_1049 [Streptomyces sp. 2321.6]SDR56063.1 hypothetical protein SAMN05216511_6169 [Streptomyces sp. KS_16]SEC04948.1 hypothetical protein SAMN05428940_1048 [Streptomyces sp. 2133.1]SED23912.1 hypothetical protein SAMN05428945_4289 [Streptomyces sp. 2224.1]SNC64170.1 hypothetical protein SAMN06272741_1047 [Streptomyces sp. 2114.4]
MSDIGPTVNPPNFSGPQGFSPALSCASPVLADRHRCSAGQPLCPFTLPPASGCENHCGRKSQQGRPRTDHDPTNRRATGPPERSHRARTRTAGGGRGSGATPRRPRTRTPPHPRLNPLPPAAGRPARPPTDSGQRGGRPRTDPGAGERKRSAALPAPPKPAARTTHTALTPHGAPTAVRGGSGRPRLRQGLHERRHRDPGPLRGLRRRGDDRGRRARSRRSGPGGDHPGARGSGAGRRAHPVPGAARLQGRGQGGGRRTGRGPEPGERRSRAGARGQHGPARRKARRLPAIPDRPPGSQAARRARPAHRDGTPGTDRTAGPHGRPPAGRSHEAGNGHDGRLAGWPRGSPTRNVPAGRG